MALLRLFLPISELGNPCSSIKTNVPPLSKYTSCATGVPSGKVDRRTEYVLKLKTARAVTGPVRGSYAFVCGKIPYGLYASRGVRKAGLLREILGRL